MKDSPDSPEAATAFLQLVRERLERGFCKDAFAVNATGEAVMVNDPGAVAWCLIGAINLEAVRLFPTDHRLIEAWAIESLLMAWGSDPNRTKEDVVSLIDRSIQRKLVLA
jgi:hypothetical protein